MLYPRARSHLKFVVANLCLASLALGCVGEAPPLVQETADAGSGEQTPAQLARKQFDDTVAPLLSSLCKGCHATGGSASAFLGDGGSGMHKAVLEWPNLISFRVPGASSLLVRGAHAGPAWQPEQATAVRTWIEAEAEIAPVDDSYLQTTPFVPTVGDNTIDLASVGLDGASITFRMDRLGSGLYLTLLTVNAGSEGIHLVHPTFVAWEGDTPKPDSVDRFSSVDLFAAALESVALGGGTAILIGPTATTPLSLRFDKAEVADEGSTVLVGCNDVASFTQNAQGPLATNCASCHDGTNASATNATDMSKIADLSSEGQAAVCGQILSRVSLGDPQNSSTFLACQPGSTLGHQFKFGGSTTAFTNFRSALLVWINAEKAAQ